MGQQLLPSRFNSKACPLMRMANGMGKIQWTACARSTELHHDTHGAQQLEMKRKAGHLHQRAGRTLLLGVERQGLGDQALLSVSEASVEHA